MRVVIADDAALLRHGLARLLDEAGVEVCGVAEEAGSLLTLVEASHPDVAIVDIRMPPTHTDEGLVAADDDPGAVPWHRASSCSRSTWSSTYALRLLDADSDSGRGYLLKDRVLEHRLPSSTPSTRVAAGEVVVDPDLVAQLLLRRPHRNDPLAELTTREREVLALVAEGLTDRGIAQRLWLTPQDRRDSCPTHPPEARSRTDCHRRVHAKRRSAARGHPPRWHT